jgi:hypothetical protein
MPDALGPASEFGGKVQRNRVQPLPHVPTPSERLMLMYTTGDESGLTDPDPNNDVFAGMLPEEEQRAIRQAEGVLEKGQEWEALKQQGAQDIADLVGEGEIVA